MSEPDAQRVAQYARILEVSRQLARGFDLNALLEQIVEAGRDVLDADRGSVFLYDRDAHELHTVVSTGVKAIRVSADAGIVGECVKTLAVVNVPNAYADPRFSRAVDRRTGYRTRCVLAVPLIGHDDQLVGVLQLLNKNDGVFDAGDAALAEVLAAQCAVALQRVRATEQLIETERLTRELALARDIQMGFLPDSLPVLDDYDFAALAQPAEETGGDTFDLAALPDGSVAVLLGDATGHGLAPALSVTQVRSMLRVALGLDAGLDEVAAQINRQLCADLPANRFVTAFLGILDPVAHRVHYHAAGQAPLMIYRAAEDRFEWLQASAMPLGLFDQVPAAPPALELEPGDILGLITDGLYERESPDGEQFGTERTEALVREWAGAPLSDVLDALMSDCLRHGDGAPQDDDITLVLVRRNA